MQVIDLCSGKQSMLTEEAHVIVSLTAREEALPGAQGADLSQRQVLR